jgi:hypothetical protein
MLLLHTAMKMHHIAPPCFSDERYFSEVVATPAVQPSSPFLASLLLVAQVDVVVVVVRLLAQIVV